MRCRAEPVTTSSMVKAGAVTPSAARITSTHATSVLSLISRMVRAACGGHLPVSIRSVLSPLLPASPDRRSVAFEVRQKVEDLFGVKRIQQPKRHR